MKYLKDISKLILTTLFQDTKIRFSYYFIVLLVVVSTAILAYKVTDTTYLYAIGESPEMDIKVPRDIYYIKEEETRKRKKQVADSTKLVFDKDSAVLDSRLNRANVLMNAIVKTLDENPPIGTDDLTFQLASLKSKLPGYIKYSDSILLNLLKFDNPRLLKRSINKILIYIYDYRGLGILDKKYSNPVGILNNNITVRSINSTDPDDEISGIVGDLVTESKIKKRIYSVCRSVAPYLHSDTIKSLSQIISTGLKANLSFNAEETRRRIDERMKQVKPVMGILKKGFVVARKGEPVTNDTLKRLNIINKYAKTSHITYTVGVILLQFLFISILSYFSIHYKKYFHPDKKSILVIFSLVTFFMVYSIFVDSFQISAFSKMSYVLLLPLAFVTMMISILYNLYLSLFTGLYLVFFTVMLIGFDLQVMVLAFSSALVGSFVNIGVEKRSDFFRGGVVLGFVNVFTIVSVSLIENTPWKVMLANSEMAMVNGILCSILALGIFPVYEHAFDITTKFKLLELSDLNADIFKNMLVNAPGTYNHSLLVSTLAEAACKDIGANYMLARVGAFYHDIGKLQDPGLYIENTITDHRAKKLSPVEYSKLIISHVSKGIDMARKHSLPEDVIDFIREHHGNSTMSYFYHQALERIGKDGKDEIKKSDFQYPGPKPHSKETAIVMLADAIEAASRSLKNPSREKIEGMVRKIIYNKLNDGDLDNSDLSMVQLKNVQSSFLSILFGIFHTRLEYPDHEKLKLLEEEVAKRKAGNEDE